MGRTDASGRHLRRQRRLVLFLYGFLILGVSMTNVAGVPVARAISLPIPLTEVVDTTPPAVPAEPFFPADQAHVSQLTEYRWGASTDDSGQSVKYEFQYGRELNENGTIKTIYGSAIVDEPRYAPSTSQDDGVWYWQVQSRDASSNSSAWSAVHKVTIDTIAPSISHNLSTNKKLNDTETLSALIEESNPSEYSIQVLNPDDTNVVVDDNPVGIIQNPASGGRVDFEWDTMQVPNGNYQVVYGARDKAGNSQTIKVPVIVDNPGNPGAGSFFPPLTPNLTPIALSETVVMTVAQEKLTRTSEPTDDTPDSEVLAEKTDTLAKRIETTAAATQKSQRDPASHCALFFGVCWYWSVPGAILIAVIGYFFYHFRQKVA